MYSYETKMDSELQEKSAKIKIVCKQQKIIHNEVKRVFEAN